MIEIKTRRFRLEEDEYIQDYIDYVRNLPGFIPGTLFQSDNEIIADFWEKII